MIAQRILVPIDFSPCSKLALHLAVGLANGHRETAVFVLHVADRTVPSFDEELGVLEPEVLQAELETLAASRSHDVRIDTVVRYGEPASTILDLVEELGIDLIVMGTRGKRGIVQALVGTTAETVMRKAACPVLSVNDRSAHTE